MKARLAVEKSFGGIDRACELVVKETAAIIEPLRVGGLGVVNSLGKLAAVGDDENVQGRILAAVFRQTVNHMPAVRRGTPPVQRHVAVRAARLGGIDEHAVVVRRPLAHEELEIVRAQWPLREECQAARALHAAGCHRIAR
jgi:hypothetical protein